MADITDSHRSLQAEIEEQLAEIIEARGKTSPSECPVFWLLSRIESIGQGMITADVGQAMAIANSCGRVVESVLVNRPDIDFARVMADLMTDTLYQFAHDLRGTRE
jgi:hypothetical protein